MNRTPISQVKSVGKSTPKSIDAQAKLEQLKATLKTGELMRGRVVKLLGGNNVLVNLKGLNLIAETNMRLTQGNIVQAQVLSVDEKITLRLLNTEKNQTKSTESIVELLTNFDIPSTEQNQELVKASIEHNIPLTEENLMSLANYAQSTPDLSAEMATVAWLLELPPDSHLINAMELAFSSKERLGGKLQRLRNSLEKILGRSPDSIDSKLIGEILELIGNSLHGKSAAELAENIQKFTGRLGLGYEAELLAMANSPELTRELIESSNGKLKALLLRLASQIKEMPGNDAELTEATENIVAVLSTLDSHEIAMSRELTHSNQIYFQMPYDNSNPNQPLTAEIVARSPYSEPSQIDPENMSVEMLIETENLGTLKVNLQLVGRNMSCAICTENSEFTAFVGQWKNELIERMKTLKYNMSELTLEVASERQLKLEKVPIVPHFSGDTVRVDVSV